MLKRIIISTSLILASGLVANAATDVDDKEVKELIEQEFQSIDLDADEEISEENADGKFEFIDQAAQKSKTKEITIKNEFFESVKVVLSSENEKATVNNKEIYLNAYETNEAVTVSKGVQYDVEVYNLYNEYLGHIYKANTKSKNKISISPFLLIKDKPEAKKAESKAIKEEPKKQEIAIKVPEEKKEDSSGGFKSIKESSNYSHEIITHKETEETKIFRETEKKVTEEPKKEAEAVKEEKTEIPNTKIETCPTPKEIKITTTSSTKSPSKAVTEGDSKLRSIKVANISDDEIRINLIDPMGNPIGGGWTISNDVYVPQFLNLKSEPVNIEPGVKLLINNSKSEEIITKYAKDLNVDEKGNYVWFVD